MAPRSRALMAAIPADAISRGCIARMIGGMAKGDYIEVLVDAGGGTAREYVIRASRAGRRVDVRTSRTVIEVNELSRNGKGGRRARFMASRVLAVVEHPNGESDARG